MPSSIGYEPKHSLEEEKPSFPDNSDVDLGDPKGPPINQGTVSPGGPAASSALVPSVTSIVVPSSKRGRVDLPAEDPARMTAKSPPKEELKLAVANLEDKIQSVELSAEEYTARQKEELLHKAKIALDDQSSRFERTAKEFEQASKDKSELEVSLARAELIGEATKSLGTKDSQIHKEASQVVHLRTSLMKAESQAASDKAAMQSVKSEARAALTDQKAVLISESQNAIQTNADASSNIIRDLRKRLSESEGYVARVKSEGSIVESHLNSSREELKLSEQMINQQTMLQNESNHQLHVLNHSLQKSEENNNCSRRNSSRFSKSASKPDFITLAR